MNDVSCKLLSTTIYSDKIGNQKREETEIEIPIIRIEDIYQDEFYAANQQGFKPSLRLKISKLNYNNEENLIYMDDVYKIIRVQNITYDEIVLICERMKRNATHNNK